MDVLPLALPVLDPFQSKSSTPADSPAEEQVQFEFEDSLASGTTSRRTSFGARTVVQELEPVDRGRGALKFLVASWILEMFIWGYGFSFGVLQVYLSSHEPFSSSSKAAISSVGSSCLAIQYIAPLLVIFAHQRYPEYSKRIVWTATAVNFVAMFTSSFATNVVGLILLQGVLAGIAGAVQYTFVVIWLPQWFVERRGLATGVIFSGTGIGGFVFPLLLGALLDKVGFGWTIRIWSVLSLLACGSAITMLRPRLPVVSYQRAIDRPAFLPKSFAFARDPTVLIMCATVLFASLAFFPVSIYLSTFTAAVTGSSSSAAAVLAVFNIVSVVAQVSVGWIADRYSYPTILTILGLCQSIAAFLSFGFASSLPQVFGFAVLFGAFSGLVSVWSTVAREVAGANPYLPSLVFSAFGIARGIASIAGPVIASLLFDETDDSGAWGRYGFRRIVLFVSTMALLSSISGFSLRFVRKRT